jgi:hypothetical protein
MRIRIQGAKPMRIHKDPDSDPGQTLSHRRLNFYINSSKIMSISMLLDPDSHNTDPDSEQPNECIPVS